MSDKALNFASTPIASTAAPLCASWPALPEAEAYIYCRLSVPLDVNGAATLLAGGLDLMMERYVIAANHTALTETSVRAGHRLVVGRTAERKLIPVSGLTLQQAQGEPSTPSLSSIALATHDWWSPAPGRKRAAPPTARARIEEPVVARAAPAFVERPMTVREGRARKKDLDRVNAPAHISPTEAWQAQVKPRMEKRRVTDAGVTSEPQVAHKPSEHAPSAPPHLQWVLIGSKSLIRCESLAPNLRKLRGYFRVGFTGIAERAWLQNQADRCGVPLDGIIAMAPNHPEFWNALDAPAGTAAVIVSAEDDSAAGTRRIEATADSLTGVCDALIAEKRSEA